MKNRIQVSQDTGRILKDTGKGRWVIPRESTVKVKGKGELQTYWLSFGEMSSKPKSAVSPESIDSSIDYHEESKKDPFDTGHNQRHQRLVDWNVEMLQQILKSILARRPTTEKKGDSKEWDGLKVEQKVDTTVLDEVQEIIELPSEAAEICKDPESVELPPGVIEQLTDYISKIAGMHHENSFHSFDNASHVTQSVLELLSRGSRSFKHH
jgi:hypothetical protein